MPINFERFTKLHRHVFKTKWNKTKPILENVKNKRILWNIFIPYGMIIRQKMQKIYNLN